MLMHRVMPVLLLQDRGLYKTRQFKKPVYVGDPINTIRIFNEKEVDELIVLDIGASRQRREPDFEMIEACAGECFMPLTYGGGITTLDEASRLFGLGVEKVCLQTSALRDISLITQIAERFGSQAVAVSIDVKRDWLGKPRLYEAGRGEVGREGWLDFARRAEAAGAGEIIVGAVNQDGTLEGPDLKLIEQAGAVLSIPLVATGGISSLADIRAVIDAGASAVGAGAFFVFHGPHRAVLITYPRYAELEDLFT